MRKFLLLSILSPSMVYRVWGYSSLPIVDPNHPLPNLPRKGPRASSPRIHPGPPPAADGLGHRVLCCRAPVLPCPRQGANPSATNASIEQLPAAPVSQWAAQIVKP